MAIAEQEQKQANEEVPALCKKGVMEWKRMSGVPSELSEDAASTWHLQEEEEAEGGSENFGGKVGQERNRLICNQGKQLSHAPSGCLVILY